VLWDGKFNGAQAPAGTYTLTIKAKDAAGNETRKLGVITIDLFSFLLDIPPFDPPTSPISFMDENVETAVEEDTSTTDFGGTVISRSDNDYTKTTFLAPSTTTPLTATDSANVVWGAIAAAAVAATLAEWQRKREEEEAAQRAADRAAFEARVEENGRKNDNRILSYKERAKAYQASLDNFKAGLIKNGFSEKEASRMKSNAVLGGSIPSVASVVASKNRSVAMESKMAREDAAEEARWLAMKEAQQAFLHSSQGTNWILANTPKLQEQYAREQNASPNWFQSQVEGWKGFVDKWTSSAPPDNLFEPPQWLNTAPIVQWSVEYLDSVADSSVQIPSDSKIVNLFNNISSYTRGHAIQFADDMTMGLFSWFTGLQPENGNPFFQEGRQIGRIFGTVAGWVEVAAGLTLFVDGAVKFIGSLAVDTGCTLLTGPGGAACAAATAPIAIAGVSEMVGGLVIGGHGAGVLWNNANHPLQIKGDSSSSGNSAYEIAKSGGRHGGMYKIWNLFPDTKIRTTIRSYEKVVQEHYDKLKNPEKWINNWNELPEFRKEIYLKDWQGDIARNQEFIDVLKGILQERGVAP
jgi:hypothetical protein